MWSEPIGGGSAVTVTMSTDHAVTSRRYYQILEASNFTVRRTASTSARDLHFRTASVDRALGPAIRRGHSHAAGREVAVSLSPWTYGLGVYRPQVLVLTVYHR